MAAHNLVFVSLHKALPLYIKNAATVPFTSATIMNSGVGMTVWPGRSFSING